MASKCNCLTCRISWVHFSVSSFSCIDIWDDLVPASVIVCRGRPPCALTWLVIQILSLGKSRFYCAWSCKKALIGFFSVDAFQAVNQLCSHFEAYRDIPKITELREKFKNIKQILKSHVFSDFSRYLFLWMHEFLSVMNSLFSVCTWFVLYLIILDYCFSCTKCPNEPLDAFMRNSIR